VAEIYNISSNILIYFFHFCWQGAPEYIYFDKLSQGNCDWFVFLERNVKSSCLYRSSHWPGYRSLINFCTLLRKSNMFRYSNTLNCSMIWPVHAAGIKNLSIWNSEYPKQYYTTPTELISYTIHNWMTNKYFTSFVFGATALSGPWPSHSWGF
jgi:hypothetical protein